MANQTVAIGSRPALVLALVAGVVGVPRSAQAESVPPEAPPAAVDVRAFAGFGSGIAVDAWLPGRCLRVASSISCR